MTVSRSETYKYDQVSRYINGLIEKGDLKPGDKAPSLRKLSKQLGVSIATITQAYVNLEDQGILLAKPQSGFYVNAPRHSSLRYVRSRGGNADGAR
ncbi:MAG: winged helix-turn-helix domain-containing protein, partial [Pseudomonadota bacterium]